MGEGEKEDHKDDEVLMRPNFVLEADPERVALAEMADWLGDEKLLFQNAADSSRRNEGMGGK